jgi:predicted flap endonuclease-1-like 5' DNA nuclease
MFKDYMGIFKNLRDMQDQLWKESMAKFPGSAFPADMNDWQQKTLENVNDLVQQAVDHSLQLQREWLDQWSERAGGKKLKPKVFAELSAEARDSTQRWLDHQNRLWEQWLQVLGAGGDSTGKLPDFAQWQSAVQESIERQMSLMEDWSNMTKVKKLSGKEVTKLSGQIEKAIEKSIETQQRLWSHWFKGLGSFAEVAEGAAVAAAKPAKPKAKSAAKPKKKAAAKAAAGHDDLKQIAGIGPGLEKKLKDSGIHTLRQIAELSDKDITHLEEEIIKFSGRINRDKWVQQAKKLVS